MRQLLAGLALGLAFGAGGTSWAANGQSGHVVLTYGEVLHADCPAIMAFHLISNSSISLTCEDFAGHDLEGDSFDPPPKKEPGTPRPLPPGRTPDCAGRRHPEKCR